ncbi:DUF6235 family protein [Streptomyces sp. CAU 1734]|uniref:DUF6235 family protein n=1 Tax=Streptomyces sp. CAU 1734 TaxID=3140360 RepID=UPI0032612D13
MRQLTVRAERRVVGFSPVRALINTGVTAEWPRRARTGLRLIDPDDPACAADGDGPARADEPRAGDRTPPLHRERVVRAFRDVGRAWLDQVGPCRVDVLDAHLLDDGSRLFFETLATLTGPAGGPVAVGYPEAPAGAADISTAARSERVGRIENLAGPDAELSGEEADFLYEQAVGYLRTGDGWTAERILRAILRRRPDPEVWGRLRLARAMLGRPAETGPRPAHPGPSDSDSGGSGNGRERDTAAGRTTGKGTGTGRSKGTERETGADTGLGTAAALGGPPPPLRLESGWDLLEKWSDTAGQINKNAVHKALFAIADRTAFRTYETFDDATQPRDFFVLVKDNLVLKICVRDFHAFAIAYVGPIDGAPGIDLGTGRAA